jgi:hypothetical protein
MSTRFRLLDDIDWPTMHGRKLEVYPEFLMAVDPKVKDARTIIGKAIHAKSTKKGSEAPEPVEVATNDHDGASA